MWTWSVDVDLVVGIDGDVNLVDDKRLGHVAVNAHVRFYAAVS